MIKMSLNSQQLVSILKLRAVGWSQTEIAESLGISQQVVAYNLKKMKEKSMKNSPDEVFSATLLKGLTGGKNAYQVERMGALITLMGQLKTEK